MDAVLVGLLPDTPADLPGVRVGSLKQACEQQLPLVLGWFEGRLALKSSEGKESPLAVDFSSGKQGYRLAADRVRHERLIKALGGMPTKPLSVIDGTGGLGRDALVMAQAGFHVVIIERSPIIHALLADGITRLAGEDRVLAGRLTLHYADSLDWLTAPLNDNNFFAVYLDPMFPARQKSAAIKKDLLWLQQLQSVPQESESEQLLIAARVRATKRVVVKRPLRALPLAQQTPSYVLAGKAVRFDVYLMA